MSTSSHHFHHKKPLRLRRHLNNLQQITGFVLSNIMQTMAATLTMRLSTIVPNITKQFHTVVSMLTFKMALLKDQLGTSLTPQEPCYFMQKQDGQVQCILVCGHMQSGWLYTSITQHQFCLMENQGWGELYGTPWLCQTKSF